MKCVNCGDTADYIEGGRSICKVCLLAMKHSQFDILSKRENAFMKGKKK